jgi:hypothetical protein
MASISNLRPHQMIESEMLLAQSAILSPRSSRLCAVGLCLGHASAA